MISDSGPRARPSTSSLRSSISRGRPDSRSRPRTAVTSSCSSGAADPIAELDRLGALGADRHDVALRRCAGPPRRGRSRPRAPSASTTIAADRDDRDLAGPAPDVDHHARRPAPRSARRRRWRRRSAPRSGAPRARPPPSQASSTARRSTSVIPDGAHTTRRGCAAALDDLAHEVAQHLLGDVEVGDHAVAQRARGRQVRRRAPDHALGVGADGVDLSGALVDRDHRRLGQHDATAARHGRRCWPSPGPSPCRAPAGRSPTPSGQQCQTRARDPSTPPVGGLHPEGSHPAIAAIPGSSPTTETPPRATCAGLHAARPVDGDRALVRVLAAQRRPALPLDVPRGGGR